MSLSAEVGAFRLKALANVDHVRKATAIKLFSSIIMDSPVLSGRLRANWQFTIGSPATGAIDLTDDSSTEGGSHTVYRMVNGVDASRLTDTVIITNNLPYAARIEFEGHSKIKAPEGMMRRNITRFNEILEESVREL